MISNWILIFKNIFSPFISRRVPLCPCIITRCELPTRLRSIIVSWDYIAWCKRTRLRSIALPGCLSRCTYGIITGKHAKPCTERHNSTRRRFEFGRSVQGIKCFTCCKGDVPCEWARRVMQGAATQRTARRIEIAVDIRDYVRHGTPNANFVGDWFSRGGGILYLTCATCVLFTTVVTFLDSEKLQQRSLTNFDA